MQVMFSFECDLKFKVVFGCEGVAVRGGWKVHTFPFDYQETMNKRFLLL